MVRDLLPREWYRLQWAGLLISTDVLRVMPTALLGATCQMIPNSVKVKTQAIKPSMCFNVVMFLQNVPGPQLPISWVILDRLVMKDK